MMKVMKRFIGLVFAGISLFFYPKESSAIFGSSRMALIDYYEFGRLQTGVASVSGINSNLAFVQGTASLIKTDDPALIGKVLLGAAHVFKGMKVKNVTIKFTDAENKWV